MDNNKKFVEEDSLEMPGDTKQWLSKLLEAPIMQATNYSRKKFLFFSWGNPSPEKLQKKRVFYFVQHITWILGPLSFKKQIHDGVDVNGNG